MSSRRSSFASRRGKARVDAPVGLELAALEACQVDAEVQQRPEAVVREPVVVAVELVLREVERRERHAIHFLGAQSHAARGCGAAAPAEPEPATLVQCLDEADGESARGRGAANRTHAIRNRDEARRSLHEYASQGRESRVAALMMPTSE